MLRQPIVTTMGHVDHGKTTLLDKVRGSALAQREAGGITQAIGASTISINTIKKICGSLLDKFKISLVIPGLLFIDTPGHSAFISLRKRGGSLADIAVLVVDVIEGFMPQTIECINILKQMKIPFVVAANKIDLLDGWSSKKSSFLESFASQSPSAQKKLENAVYELVGKLYEFGFEAERFDRVSDFSKQIVVIPVSAKTGEGIPELIVMISGLAQKFLEKKLAVDVSGSAKGTVLEVKEEKGHGTALDVILYDGKLKIGDSICLGTLKEPVVSRVKTLLAPVPLADVRDKKTKFKSVKEVFAATGVKVVAQNTEDVVAGMPLLGISNNEKEVRQLVVREIKSVTSDVSDNGVIIKADTLGSLEALLFLLKESKIPVSRASIGPITKKDISDAEAMRETNPLFGVILGFNIPAPIDASVKVVVNSIIYRIIEDYNLWVAEQKKQTEKTEMESLVRPCKIQSLRGYVFRQSNPAIFGIEVLAGTLKPGTPLMRPDGSSVAVVKGIQKEQENVDKAVKGDKLAVALPGIIVGRQVHEGDTFLSSISEEHFRKFKEFKQYLSQEEKELLKEIAQIMRKKNPVWGV